MSLNALQKQKTYKQTAIQHSLTPLGFLDYSFKFLSNYWKGSENILCDVENTV